MKRQQLKERNMKVKELKNLLNQFDENDTIVIANYSEEDSEGNMPVHSIQGAEYLPVNGKVNINIVAIHFDA
jgi:hypothetical protein